MPVNRKKPRPRVPTKKTHWNQGHSAASPGRSPLPPFRNADVDEALALHLIVGSVLKARLHMERSPVDTDKLYPMNVLAAHQPQPWNPNYSSDNIVVAHPGDGLIYTGAVRCEERVAGGNRVLSVNRHTFIVGCGRYIIIDINYLVEPIT